MEHCTAPELRSILTPSMKMTALWITLTISTSVIAGQPTMPPNEWRSRFGWQDLRFGMTWDDVKAKYPKAYPQEGGLNIPNLRVIGYQANALVQFSAGRLWSVNVYIYCHDDCTEILGKLNAGLTEKYGTPTCTKGFEPAWCVGPRNKEIDRVPSAELVSTMIVPAANPYPAFVSVFYMSGEIPARPSTEGL